MPFFQQTSWKKTNILKVAFEIVYQLKTSISMLHFLIFASVCWFFCFMRNKVKISLFSKIFDHIWHENLKIGKNMEKWETQHPNECLVNKTFQKQLLEFWIFLACFERKISKKKMFFWWFFQKQWFLVKNQYHHCNFYEVSFLKMYTFINLCPIQYLTKVMCSPP